MVRLATHAMDFDGAVWHDEQAVRVVRAAVLGDHRRGPGMRRLQLLGNDVRTRDALSRISDDLRGADVHGRADVDDAPVLRFVQGYGMLFPVAERRSFPVHTASSDCTGCHIDEQLADLTISNHLANKALTTHMEHETAGACCWLIPVDT